MSSDPRENFTGLAAVYAAARPSYPPAAMRFVLGAATRGVADVGCGTGISTRLLAAAFSACCTASHDANGARDETDVGRNAIRGGFRVVGVEPNADMLAAARAEPGVGTAGSIEYVQATAEATGLPDGAFDLVTCFQSFHWFDPPRALAEFRRLLVPGGRVALVWNVRVPEDPVTRGFQDVVERAQADAAARGVVVRPDRCFAAAETPGFVEVGREAFPNPHRLGLEALLRRASSASYYPRSGPSPRAGSLRAELDAVLAALHRRFAIDGVVELQQRTEVTILQASQGA